MPKQARPAADPLAARGRATRCTITPAFADTNLLVYAFDGDEPVKRRQAVATLHDEGDSIVISTQVLAEFYVVVTRELRNPLSESEAEHAVEALCHLPVVATDRDLVAAGIARSRGSRLSLWDALIVEAALTAGCERLLTEDLAEGASFGALRVQNPFRAV